MVPALNRASTAIVSLTYTVYFHGSARCGCLSTISSAAKKEKMRQKQHNTKKQRKELKYK
jgi:hypothetical protein